MYIKPEDKTEVQRELDKAQDMLAHSREILQELYDQGKEKLDNMPESAEGSDELEHLVVCTNSSMCISSHRKMFYSARLGSIEDAISYIEAAESRVDDAIPEAK